MTSNALDRRPWWTLLNRYHWYVFALAAMGWLFDTMDQRIFTASRDRSMEELVKVVPAGVELALEKYRDVIGFRVTSVFIVGWATGGLIFGIIGDRWGRAKTMALTILIYAGFTGLSGLSRTWEQFAICRFLTGMGVGGEFAAGAALVAEVMPSAARASSLGALQALSAVGNISGALLFGYIEPAFTWRWLYYVGAFPALLAVIVRMGLKEPEPWLAAKAAQKAGGSVKMGRISELFSIPRWRRNSIAGLALAISGQIGLWGIGFYTPRLIKEFTSPAERTHLIMVGMILQDTGAVVAMYFFSVFASRIGRRPTFLMAFAVAWISVLVTFYSCHTATQVYYLFPLLGFGTLAPFGGYAVYFPEIFPTRLRTTGTGLCYNVGRYISAAGPLMFGYLMSKFDDVSGISSFRLAAIVLSSVYLVGMVALIWAPETMNQPLPEDEPVPANLEAVEVVLH